MNVKTVSSKANYIAALLDKRSNSEMDSEVNVDNSTLEIGRHRIVVKF